MRKKQRVRPASRKTIKKDRSLTPQQPIVSYPYRDASGHLLYEVVRSKSKTFHQRRSDGKGGHIYNLDDVHRVVYHLPELKGHEEVFIAEGEKDVDRLMSLGIVASCNSGGAGKWTDDHTEQLRAAGVKRVSILPDQDTPGQAHAKSVARSCIAAGLSAKIVQLPDLPSKGDVSDWLDAGGTVEQLHELVQSTPEWADALPMLAHSTDQPVKRGRPRTDDPIRQVYTLDDVEGMLKVIPAEDRDLWRAVGIILGREFKRSDAAWALYVEWSSKWEGEKASNHDEVMYEAFHEISQQHADKELSLGTIVKLALDQGWEPTKKGAEVPKTNLIYLAPENAFLNLITHQCWTAKAVDTRVAPVNEDSKLIAASQWIQRNQAATSITCTPALPEGLTPGYDCFRGRKVLSQGGAIFNLYKRTMLKPGNAKSAGPFLQHCELLFNKPGDAEQFFNFMAHRVQRPEEKPRFALLIAGDQGTGKDTAVDFCCPAIGSWNVASVNPGAFDSAFNEFSAATLIRINEVANRQDLSKFAFNERTKVLIAGNPDEAEVNPKYGKKYSVLMHCGVVLTTNSLLGIYIPPDDRRYDVLLCATLAEMGLADDTIRRTYFEKLWGWFLNGGAEHVYAFLLERDLAKFSASQGQRKTDAHKMTVQENLVNDEWFADALEAEGNPTLFRGDLILERARSTGESGPGIKTKLAHAAERAGFIKYRSPIKDGRWKCADGWKCSVFIKQGSAPPTPSALKELLGRTMPALVESIYGKKKY